MSKKRTEAVEIARQQLWENVPPDRDFGAAHINRAFNAGVEAGIEQQSWDDARLDKIASTITDELFRTAASKVADRLIVSKEASYWNDDWDLRVLKPCDVHTMIFKGLEGALKPPSELPTATLKDLREAAGLSLEYVRGITQLGATCVQWEIGSFGFEPSRIIIRGFALLYKTDESAIRAAIQASRDAARELAELKAAEAGGE